MPELTTTEVSSITDSTAVSDGTITSNGGATVTARGVCWGTTQTPTISDSKTTDGDGAGTFTSEITGLVSNTTYHARAYAKNSIGIRYGNTISFVTDGPESPETGTLTDIDGNFYQTVNIGGIWWMAENLKVTHYRNGEPIPNISNYSDWVNLSTGAYYVYDNDNANISTYGMLYNWFAVDDNRNIAPDGWHVITDDEYRGLEHYLIAYGYNWDTSHQENKIGKSLASQTDWKHSSRAGDVGNNLSTNNASGFSALPGGYGLGNTFGSIGEKGYWWSSSVWNNESAKARELYYNSSWGLFPTYPELSLKQLGFSVRCAKD